MSFVSDFFFDRAQGRNIQNAASDNQELLGGIYDDSTARSEPYAQSGVAARGMMDSILGLGGPQQPLQGGQVGAPQGYTGQGGHTVFGRMHGDMSRGPQQFQGQQQQLQAGPTGAQPAQLPQGGNPGTQAFYDSPFATLPFNESLGALENGAAARGGLFSGQHQKDVINYAQNQVGNQFGNFYNALNDTATGGQRAVGAQDRAAANYGQNSLGNSELMLTGQNTSNDASRGLVNGITDGLASVFGFGI